MTTTMNRVRAARGAKVEQQRPVPKAAWALWAGIIFSLLFTGLIWGLSGRLAQIPHLPDRGAAWYYWQLPQRTFWGEVTAWGFYLAHQVAIWGLIYQAQRYKLAYTTGLHRLNLAALGVNALFVLLHLLQTHLWYDGLAQNVSIFSSQWSVILMLVVILMMENPRRGLFFGQKAPLGKRAVDFVRKYHGYLFSWAIIYTFWYHPMEATSGHLIGFFYTLLLMLQGSLFFTRSHLNKWWTFSLEALVLAHGTLVALMNANNLWPMFGFGFAGILVVTQLHGLGLPRWLRGLVLALYASAALWIYSLRGLGQIHQITWIPLTEYAVVFMLAGLISLGIWLAQHWSTKRRTTE
ncbi:MAG: hypothetical protein NT075_31205 [Chloroflexi bacterium]|nr:hypothetical protein [Chloroflexota bacterium]